MHEDDLAPENLSKYKALILPNTALLRDEQCRQLRAFAAGGGSLLATFETGLYNERNERRPDFGLADVFEIRRNGELIGTTGNASADGALSPTVAQKPQTFEAVVICRRCRSLLDR